MKSKLTCYVRPNRRRWGLSQEQLAMLLGAKTGAAISRIEHGERRPTLTVALGCQVLFGVSPPELFPGAFSEIEENVISRAYELYEKVQGSASNANRLKLDLFEQAFARATERLKQSKA